MKSRYVPEVLSIEKKYKAFRLDEDDGQSFLFTCDSCSSALDVAWNLNKEGLFMPWDSVFAAEQTAGRGQLRREWVSPKGNIYAALCLPPLLHGAGASVFVGWLVVKALHEVLGQHLPKPELAGLKLKWPNDIVLHRHKIGGILLEERNGVLIAGIGINFSFAPGADKMRENHALPAGNLQKMLECGDFLKNVSAETLWLALVSMLRFWYETKVPFTGGGIPHHLIEPQLAFLREVVRICDFFDKSDGHSKEDHERTGRILGLGPNAELRLETSGGEILLSSGSICPL